MIMLKLLHILNDHHNSPLSLSEIFICTTLLFVTQGINVIYLLTSFLQNTTSLKEVSAFYNMKLSLIIMMVLNSLFIIVTEKMLYEMELMIIEANLV